PTPAKSAILAPEPLPICVTFVVLRSTKIIAFLTAYLTGLPRGSMRTSAGFPLVQGHFYLPRAVMEPPVELQHKVFPWADEWLGKIRSGIAESSNSAISFLKMLVTFRVTFLQDVVFMKLKYPCHSIFVNPLFDDELFIQFSSDLQAAVIENEGNDPVNMQLRTAVPLIDQRLETMQKKIDNENALRNTQMQNILKQLSDISTGRVPLNINVSSVFPCLLGPHFGDESFVYQQVRQLWHCGHEE
ncbi:hypothetical protein INT48_004647, partial [Thamnidium elegans]